MEYAAMEQLETRRLILRKLRMDDARVYYERLGSSAAVTEFMLWEPHRDIGESVASIEKALRRYAEGRCYRWGIARKEDDSLIGVIELLRLDEETDTCSFAYMLAEEFWGRGYGTEALTAALDFAFRKLKVAAVEADHMAENAASGVVMRKAGMKYQRTDRAKYEKHGKVYDAPVYRITAEEWSHEL